MTNREAFHKNFKMLFDQANISQEEFGKIVGASHSTVSSWLTGRAYPRIDVMQRIADYFGITIIALISEQKIDLSVSENIVIDLYRQLTDAQKRNLINYAIIMLRDPNANV